MLAGIYKPLSDTYDLNPEHVGEEEAEQNKKIRDLAAVGFLCLRSVSTRELLFLSRGSCRSDHGNRAPSNCAAPRWIAAQRTHEFG